MKICKIGVVLLALLLAAMVIVPMVSAGKILPSQEIFEMEYLKDTHSLADREMSTERNLASEYSLVTVNTKGFLNAADTEHVILFTLGGKQYQFELEEVPVPLDKNAKLLVRTEDGISVEEIPKIKQYRAKIIGDESGNAFFTVDDKVILGKISVQNETYIIEQKGDDRNGNAIHMIYNLKNAITPKGIVDGNDIWFDYPVPSENQSEDQKTGDLKAAASTSTVDIMLVYDPEFHTIYPSSSSAEVLNMLSQASNAYSRSDVGVSFNVRAIASETYFSSTNPLHLGAEFVNRDSGMKAQWGCDLAFLFTGKNLDGGTVGLGKMYTGSESEGYALAQMVSKPGYSASSTQRSLEVAHEIGHNFGAAHDGGDPGSSGYPWYVPSWARPADWATQTKHTVMYPYVSDAVNMEFSTSQWIWGAHGDNSHDNAKRIAQTKAIVAGFR